MDVVIVNVSDYTASNGLLDVAEARAVLGGSVDVRFPRSGS